jgi:hypothetical protein
MRAEALNLEKRARRLAQAGCAVATGTAGVGVTTGEPRSIHRNTVAFNTDVEEGLTR